VSAVALAVALCAIGSLIFGHGFRYAQSQELRARLLETLAATVRRELPLAPVFQMASANARYRDRKAYERAGNTLVAGGTLSEALGAAGRRVLTARSHAAIVAAEGGGHLAAALASAARDERTRQSIAHRFLLAALYPAVAAMFIAPMGLMAERSLSSMVTSVRGGELVPVTAAGADPSWLEWNAIGVQVAAGALLAFAVAMFAVRFLSKPLGSDGTFGAGFRDLVRRIPGIRGIARLSAGSALLRGAAGQLRTGVTLPDALRLAAPLTGHAPMVRGARLAADELEAGAVCDQAFAQVPLPGSLPARVAAACGRPGDVLAQRLDELADECESRYRRAVDRAMRWTHPAGLALIGLLVAVQFNGVIQAIAYAREVARPW
jgi:type II secretory pathway component PulF